MRRVVKYLRSQGLNVWVDNEKLVPGTPVWENEIEKAIKGAFAIVVVLSPDAKNSEWVLREITLADQYQKRAFPVLVAGKNEDSIPFRLVTRQFVDLRNNEKAGLASLYNALSRYLNEVDSTQQEEELEGIENDAEEASTSLEDKRTSIPHSANQMLYWITLGWAIGGGIGGFMYDIVNAVVGGAIGGIIGGLLTVASLRQAGKFFRQTNTMLIILAWGFSGSIGWLIGWELTEAIGAGIGMIIFISLGLAFTFDTPYLFSIWKRAIFIVLAWGTGGAIGWSIAKGMIDNLGINYSTSWVLGMTIGWGIAGFVTGWQLLKKDSTN